MLFGVAVALLYAKSAEGAAGITISLRASDLAYSPLTHLLYATVPSGAQKYANSLAVIDPRTGVIVRSIPIGNAPSKLAISDDARYLYAVYDQTSIKRFDVTTLQADRSFRVPPGLAFGVPDLKVMPGHPDVVAAFLSGIQAIAIFDKGVMRPRMSSDTFGNVIAFSSDTTLWASTTIITPNQVWKYEIDGGGISKVGVGPDFYFSPFDRAIQISSGTIYSSTGNIFDIGQNGYNGIFNTDQRQTSALAIDPLGGRIYFLVPEQFQTSVLAFDLQTLRKVGAVTASGFNDIGADLSTDVMVLCGKVGLAFASREKPTVTILPLSEIKPLTPYVKPAPIPINNSARLITLHTNHVVFDAGRVQIYASIPGTVDNIGNSIMPIDPVLGSVGNPIWVGSEPGSMGLSHDGTWLYTGLDAASTIRRVFLPFQHAENSFRMRVPDVRLNPTGFTSAEDLIGVPLNPDSVLVGHTLVPGSLDFGSDGVIVYDNGVPRPISVPGDFVGGARFLQLAEDGVTAYAIEPSDNSHAFITMRMDSEGVRITSKVFNITGGRHLKCQNGLCFTEGGSIIDANSSSLIGRFDFDFSDFNFAFPTQLVPDVPNGVVYFVGASPFGVQQTVVTAYDINTRKLVSSYAVPGSSGPANDLLFWRGNQLAFNTDTHVVLLPTALLQPTH
jgi:hypothetical protein